jgi:periplasmic copper chaperone A
MRGMKRRLFLGLILLPHIAQAHSFKLGSIEIGHAWALPSANGETSAMFPILNMGPVADELIEAKSEIAKSIEFRVGNKKVDNFEQTISHAGCGQPPSGDRLDQDADC